MKKVPVEQKREDADIADAMVEHPVQLWPAQDEASSIDCVATETAVALVYNGVSHAVMMASPLQLEVFALGFSLTEGIVERAEDIYQIQVDTLDEGIEVSLTISNQCFAKLKNKRRSLSGRTGCGICGAESLQQIRPPVPEVVADYCISHKGIDRATRALSNHQPLQSLTGAIHGAAWCDVDGKLLQVCEDVGRHNALDKLIGMLWRQELLGKAGFLLISSRASHEILQKSAMANIGIVVAISAPTSLAIEIANKAGITLVGFSRENRHIAYTNQQRLVS
ncbi:MAG TPA: formate dehydrogenase accessory sulfurtransferase FdhD [Gammaproteobacteria bacterium]|nr:formate dehydrogenase accessory sulfurtransferase FdhD [Gammaproteobacteria bacterium]